MYLAHKKKRAVAGKQCFLLLANSAWRNIEREYPCDSWCFFLPALPFSGGLLLAACQPHRILQIQIHSAQCSVLSAQCRSLWLSSHGCRAVSGFSRSLPAGSSSGSQFAFRFGLCLLVWFAFWVRPERFPHKIPSLLPSTTTAKRTQSKVLFRYRLWFESIRFGCLSLVF